MKVRHPDHRLMVEQAIEPEMDRLAIAAERSGLSEAEAADTLLNLAVARVLALRSNLDTQAAIRRAMDAVHGLEP